MKCIKVINPKDIQIVEEPKPVIKEAKDVLVKVKYGGICGSDVHIYHGTNPVATYPRVIGHEFVGIVEAVGEEVTNVKPGDHVAVDPVVSCGECYACKIGRQNVCSSLKVRGVHEDGGFREYTVVTEDAVHMLSKDVPLDKAVLVEPFTIAAQSTSRAELRKDDVVFIMGSGPIGQAIARMCKGNVEKIIMSDMSDYRLGKAKLNGADVTINVMNEDTKEIIMRETNNQGVTLVIDSVCTVKSFEEAVSLTRPAARVVTLGFASASSEIAQVGITFKELDIRGSRLHQDKFPVVTELFNNGTLDGENMISHIFDFEDIHQAIKLIEDKSIEKGKIVLAFNNK
jgi:L-gulonate 5-dehydrogenase